MSKKALRKLHRSIHSEQLEHRNLLASDLGPAFNIDFDEFRSIDGSGNNLTFTDWGSTQTAFLRLSDPDYADGISAAAGEDRPSAREVSNVVLDQTESITNDRYLTDFVWQWGQFLDHDLDLTSSGDPVESLDIEVPLGDAFFDPDGTGEAVISFSRSGYLTGTGDSLDNPREQVNAISAFIDGSMVYGSDEATALALRELPGGRLKTSDGDLLPFDESGIFFVAGDVRANEQVGLTAMHTLFVREHNYWADSIAADNPELTDEEIYQQARAIVIAEIQAITYNEFLPALLGEDALGRYEGYDPTVDPSIANEFSTAAYRFGHSMLSGEILRLNNDGTTADEGNLSLRSMFFNPAEILDNDIDSLLLGLASQQAQEIDSNVVDDVRNFLFGNPGQGGFDLASLNIQRGRDHGLAEYNTIRVALGLEPVTRFDQITSDPEVAAALEEAYETVDNIDLWVAGLAENHIDGGSMGETFHAIVVDQFTRLRDGDRFWYQNVFSGRELRNLEETTLSDIVQRNTEITKLQDNVFVDAGLWQHDVTGRGREVTQVTGRGDEISVAEPGRSRRLETQSTSEIDRLEINGRDGQSDLFILDLGQFESTLAGGISVKGESGRGDVLVLVASSRDNSIEIQNGVITWNDQRIEFSGREQIVIQRAGRSDTIEIANDLETPVEMEGGRTRDHGRGFRMAADRIFARFGR